MNSRQLRAIHKYKIIKSILPNFTLKLLCKIAGVSVSGYYCWKNRKLKNKDFEITALISKIFFQHNGKIGIRRIKMELERNYNLIVNKKKIQRIKQENNLKTKIRKKRKNYSGYLRSQRWCVAENILNRQFRQNKSAKAYSTDVTYLTTKTGRYYLSVVKDLGSKEIAAYNVSTKHDLGLVMNTINQLQKHKKEAIMHSDRGGLYTSFQYIQKLKELNLTRSMSRSGNCLDNAPIESFFGHLKDEMDYRDCKSLEEIRDKIDEYIYYYNTRRYQWGLNKMTPCEFRQYLNSSY